MLEHWPFLIVRSDKLYGGVIIWQTVPACVNILSIVLRHNREVLVTCINAHHILHRVRMWFCQRAVPVPVSNDTNVKKIFHKSWQFDIVLEDTWRIFEGVIVVIRAILLSELFQKFVIRQVDSFSTFCEVGKAVVRLAFSVYDFVASLLDEVRLVLPQVVRFLQLAVFFKQARSILLHVIVKEALGRHCSIVAKWYLIIIRHLLCT